jgi:hypothetical protein
MLSFNQKLALRQQVNASGMQAVKLDMPKLKALELYRAYKTHQAYQKPEDYEIMRTYQLIAQGNVVIQAIESIRAAGLNEDGLPKLAIMRAHETDCYVSLGQSGSAEFRSDRWRNGRSSRNKISLPSGSFIGVKSWTDGHTLIPIIPVHLRPKRGLANYHVLWEAQWKKLPPGDPYLLRQIGRGDMWLVVAAWDLTDVEKAAMS